MVVYTCITNGKDNLISVNRQEGVRFVCFSDRPVRHPVWEWQQVHDYGISDPRRVARRYKILSHIYFPGEDTIWIDGRVRLLKPVSHYTQKYNTGEYILSARPHHSRACVYDEANEIKRINYDDHRIVNEHVDRLKEMQYPENNGLHETGMIYRKACYQMRSFERAWWAYLSTGSKRDQLSFDPTAWEFTIDIQPIDRNEVQVLRHKRATNAKT